MEGLTAADPPPPTPATMDADGGATARFAATAAHSTDDERDLVQRAQAGDQDSLGALFDRFYTPVYRYVRNKVAGREDAEDLAQECFVRMCQALPGYQQRGRPFRAWLMQIAANLVTDYYRRRGHASAPASLDDAELDLPDESRMADPAGQIQLQFEIEELLRALDCLTELEREVVRLRYLAELNVAETASMLGKTENNIKQLTFKAIRKLNKELNR